MAERVVNGGPEMERRAAAAQGGPRNVGASRPAAPRSPVPSWPDRGDDRRRRCSLITLSWLALEPPSFRRPRSSPERRWAGGERLPKPLQMCRAIMARCRASDLPSQAISDDLLREQQRPFGVGADRARQCIRRAAGKACGAETRNVSASLQQGEPRARHRCWCKLKAVGTRLPKHLARPRIHRYFSHLGGRCAEWTARNQPRGCAPCRPRSTSVPRGTAF